jgi:hypothetical protein
MDIQNELEYIYDLGFEQEYPNDKTYPHLSWRLDIKKPHKLLTGIHLVIASKRDRWIIEVLCLDTDENPARIKEMDYSRENLEALLRQF